MNIVQSYLKKNRCYTNAIKISVKGIIVHSTGVAQPNVNVFLKNWNSAIVSKCVHAFVSEDRVTQTLPWTYKAWHCGGSGNNSYIGFEILEPSGHTYNGGTMIGYDVAANAEYFNNVYKNAVELCAMLCEKFDLDPMTDILCHSEAAKKGIASNHADVMHWFPKHNKDMDKFRAAVKAKIKEEKEEDEVVVTKTSYLVKITADTLNVRSGPSTSYKIVTTVKKDEVYTIVEEVSGWGKLKSGAGYINLSYTEKVTASSYRVRITASTLNVRSGPSTSYKIVTTVKKDEVYTIVEEVSGWGKLKSGAGYINLSYTEKVK